MCVRRCPFIHSLEPCPKVEAAPRLGQSKSARVIKEIPRRSQRWRELEEKFLQQGIEEQSVIFDLGNGTS